MTAVKSKTVSILVVDDDKAHRYMLRNMLSGWGWQVLEADDGTTAVAAVEGKVFDAILMDVRMAKMDGMEALGRIKTCNPAIPVIIMTAYSSVDDAVAAMKNGALDYLTKPLDFDRLKLTLSHAVEHRQVAAEKLLLAKGIEKAFDRCGIIGHAPAIMELLETLSVVAPTEATVLISGQSGTGKELIARALHRNSNRRDGPFVTVNCAALVENLLESELFGHEKGSFTGADRRREGKFVQAHTGTLFLDEIGETSAGMQVKLLRVLQEHEIQRVGGYETIPVDVRILAATNRNLEQEVSGGNFREDLFYRLNVVSLLVPALRDRAGDIPLLANHFAEKFAVKNHRKVAGITPRCMDLLLNYSWPGNIRELENSLERAIILMRGEYVDEESLPLPVRRAGAPMQQQIPSSLEEAEKLVILKTLEESGGNKSEAARRLNITRKTLLSKLVKYDEADG